MKLILATIVDALCRGSFIAFRYFRLTIGRNRLQVLLAVIVGLLTWGILKIAARIAIVTLSIVLFFCGSLAIHGAVTIIGLSERKIVCRVRLSVNEEVTLVYHSWWPSSLSNDEIEPLAIEAAISSAEDWLRDQGSSSRKLSLSESEAARITASYLCQKEATGVMRVCPICLDAVSCDVLELRACNHQFHSECITKWFVKGRIVCPCCRLDQFPLLPDAVQASLMQESKPFIAIVATEIADEDLTNLVEI